MRVHLSYLYASYETKATTISQLKDTVGNLFLSSSVPLFLLILGPCIKGP